MALALDELLVVSLEQAVAAPFCSSRLADAGARVIKIERNQGGDFARRYDDIVHGESAYFVWLNRGKQSVALDIKNSEDNALIQRMIDQADVFIQNLAPGAATRAGLDSRELTTRNPRLITCDISGYGSSGPYREMRAYDLLVQCETGLASVTGSPDSPGRVGVSISDIACGMYAYSGILEALLQRQITGVGQRLSVSLFDATADWMTVPFLYQVHTGSAPARFGLNHPTIAPYGAYVSGDGQQIVIAVQNEREWHRLCLKVLEMPQLVSDERFADNPKRVAHRAELDDCINSVFQGLKLTELKSRLDEAQIAYGRVNSIAELETHPMLKTVAVQCPAGTVDIVAPPVRHSDADKPLGSVPALDQHGHEIRKEFSRTI